MTEFSHAATFKDLLFRIDASGLTLSGEVTIDGHRAVQAAVAICRDGISITGSLKDITLGAITITKAQLDVFIGRTSPGTTSRAGGFSITGDVHFHGIDVSVSVLTLVEGGQVSWTVYGELDADLRLARLAPKVEGTFLDLSLRKVAFIASNVDSPAGVEGFNVFNYPIRRGLFTLLFVCLFIRLVCKRTDVRGEIGVQFCAALDRITQLDHISGGRVEGLVLRAAYSDRGFSFGILFPAPVTVKFPAVHLVWRVSLMGSPAITRTTRHIWATVIGSGGFDNPTANFHNNFEREGYRTSAAAGIHFWIEGGYGFCGRVWVSLELFITYSML